MVDLKILESVWLRAFWAISQEQEFSNVWDLCRNAGNNINSHYRPNSVQINDQFFNKLKNLFLANFWPVFSVLGAINFFARNQALSRTTSYGFLAPCQIYKKLMVKFQENARRDGRTEVWTDNINNINNRNMKILFKTHIKNIISIETIYTAVLKVLETINK